MATGRDELTSYEYRQLRARILRESDVCIVCGHGGFVHFKRQRLFAGPDGS
ncbi:MULTISPECIES: hypothetical protein [Streptomyces]|uniref:hypothetical protein n=1 Tax=Streptomyces TaxID=1883 RepID=UPI001F502318|nr:hypothetical protein [Streptomyces lasalocidi]